MEWKEKWELLWSLMEHIEFMLFVKNILLALLISAVVSIIAVVVLRKYILVERRHWSLKVLSYIWMIGIPLFSMYTGIKYGAVHSIHKNVEHELMADIEELSIVLSERIGTEWSSALTTGSYKCRFCEDNPVLELTPANTVDALVMLVFDEYSHLLGKLTNVEQPFLQKIGTVLNKTLKLKLVKWGVKKGINKLLESAGLTEHTSEVLLDTKMNELLEEGVLSKIVMIQLDELFGGIKKGMFFMFLLVLLFPIAEILYAHYWFRKRDVKILE